jgi:PAS domain S-box-containing protein
MNSSADYQGLLALSPDGVIVVRPDCSILTVNDNLVALFGYSAADLQGVPLEFLLPGADESVLQLQASATHKGPLEYWVQNADGATLAVDVTLSTAATQSPSEGLVCISVRDATWRKKTEQALEEAHLRSERMQRD